MPKAFLSHSSKDKERFVEPLARKLVEGGLEVFYDVWDIQAGDSLPQTLYRGIDEAGTFVLVWSKNAEDSAWVREELESGTHKKIEQNGVLIPIIIKDDGLDESEFPGAIKHLLQSRVNAPSGGGSIADEEVEAVAQSILRVVFDIPEQRPPLGPPPSYAASPPSRANAFWASIGLDQSELAVLKIIGELANENENDFINTSDVVDRARVEHDFTQDDTLDHLEILESSVGHIKIGHGMHSDRLRRLGHFHLLDKGLMWYFKTFVEESAEIERAVYAVVANGGPNGDLKSVANELDAPILLVRLVGEQLKERNAIIVSDGHGSEQYIVLSMPVLRKIAKKPPVLTELPDTWKP